MTVTFQVEDRIGTLLIDRQSKLNALDVPTFEAIERVLDQASRDTDLLGLMFFSAGTKAFSVGADISELKIFDNERALQVARYRQAVLSKLSNLEIPTLSGIQGYALGGGLELALSCTFRVATADAQLGFPEINLGLLPGAGGTQRLPKLIGKNRAMNMMLTARMIGGEEALGFGLIDAIVDQAREGGLQFLQQVTRYSAGAVRGIMTCINASDLPLESGLKIENQQLSVINNSADAKEGVSAFMEKRNPVFNQSR
ncbi:enoyl-CoA hydratase/isomerase family protein [Pseudomonas putida]